MTHPLYITNIVESLAEAAYNARFSDQFARGYARRWSDPGLEEDARAVWRKVGDNSKPYKLDDPQPYVSGYTLCLYCDHDNPDHKFREFPHEFNSEWKTEAFRTARRRGWMIRIDGSSTCPKCCKALRIGKFCSNPSRSE